ncbi:MAG: hypothetical protein L3J09_00275 [Flavobacteriaceae bacterium]|nr:hypothetical protein [Flavobacteriaceae bacterium]
MKKTFFYTLLLLFTSLVVISCDSQDIPLEEEALVENLVLKSREQVEALGLESIFNLDQKVYTEFLENIVFDELGNFRGAKIDGISKELNENQKEKFWKNFGLTYKNGFSQENNKDLVYEFYKPRWRGCKWNVDWICVVYTDPGNDL